MLHMRVSQAPIEFSLHMRAQFLFTLHVHGHEKTDTCATTNPKDRSQTPRPPETLQATAVVNKECLSQSHANCASRQITCRPCGCGWARLVQLSQDDAGCFR
jgi:hypothetical protein